MLSSFGGLHACTVETTRTHGPGPSREVNLHVDLSQVLRVIGPIRSLRGLLVPVETLHCVLAWATNSSTLG